jgi:hypothetical protein
MTKLDLKKELKHLYNPPANKVTEVDVPPANYLMIGGQGDPNTSQEYRQAVEALFSVSYGLKFAVKEQVGVDYSVMPLEGLWWTKGNKPFTAANTQNKKDWRWTAMISQPSMVTRPLLACVLEQTKKKKALPALPLLRFEALTEGKAVQILHIGPYSAEEPTITKLHDYARERGYSLTGKHHEIYLNTPDRTAPQKLKTVIRHPVRK